MPIFDHFGFVAPFYERVIAPRVPEKLIALAGLPAGGRLLDAGGGTGRLAQHFCERAGQVVVIDLSSKMLLQAAQKPGLRLAQASSERLPFPDGAFDRVIMVDAFHHVMDQPETARELWRVLKPGGRLLIEEPDIRTLVVKLVALAEKMALMRSHFLSAERISALFPDPSARVQITRESFNVWVCVDKGE